MPVLVGLITYLALAGVPGKPETFTAKTEDTSAKGGATGITGLVLGARPGANYGTFAAKATATADSRAVTDTYLVRLQFGDVSAVDLALTDRYVPVLSLAAVSSDTRLVSDRYVPRLTFGFAALEKSGAISYSGTDTYVPVLTLAVTQRDVQSVTDTYVPVLTFGSALAASDEVVLTDSYVLVLGMNYYLQTIIANVSRPVLDSYVPVLTFTGAPWIAGEIDDIRIDERPFGYIRIEEA